MAPLVILNPAAGRAHDPARVRAALETGLPGAELRTTAAPGEAGRLAREAAAAGRDPLVVAGGDGLLLEVVNGLSPDPGAVRIGLLPLGTGNDVARSLGIPPGLERGLGVIRAGRTLPIDLVRLRPGPPELFVNVAVAGFAGVVAARVGAAAKRSRGPVAYRLAALTALPSLRRYAIAAEVDGEALSLEGHAAVVANGRFLGGGLSLVPEARMDDGLLDLLVIPVLSPHRLAAVVARVLIGKDPGPAAIRRRGRVVRLAMEPALHLGVDGEDVPDPRPGGDPGGERTTGPGSGGEARFRAVAGALRVLVPAGSG